MTAIVNIALINAVTVVPLALLVWAVGRMIKRPALTHGLWVLVLVKFVTLPLVILPWTIELPATDQPVVVESHQSVVVESQLSRVDFQTIHDSYDQAIQNDAQQDVTATTSTPVDLTPSFTPQSAVDERLPVSFNSFQPAAATNRTGSGVNSFFGRASEAFLFLWRNRPGVPATLLIVWFAGIAIWTVSKLSRAIRFQRRVRRDAIAVYELCDQTEQLAKKMGLRSSPQVRIINATVSPMLWGCGSWTVLLFPADLAERLDDESRATLLTHELAHYSRGDHVVRLLELIVLGLFWWHPVAWWARRQIEEAEEECCDAWVISEFPHAPRRYAQAILDTIDFLCEAPADLPPISSGLGQSHFLRHRLTKIVRGVSPKTMSLQNRLALIMIAALMLPLHPFALGSSSLQDARNQLVQKTGTELSASSNTGASRLASKEETSESTEQPPATDVPSPAPAAKSALPRRPGEQTWANAVSPDARFVVRTTTARRVILSDLANSREADLSDEGIAAVSFSPEGDWFVSVNGDGNISVWDSARAEKLRTLAIHDQGLRTVAVSPNGEMVACGSRDGAVLIYDALTGRSLIEIPKYSAAVNCVRFSPSGDQLAIAVGDWQSAKSSQVALLDLKAGKITTTLECATSPGALAYASDEELIVGHWDGRTQLWNLGTHKMIGTAMANKGVVAAAAFSPDNPVLREVTFGFVDQAPKSNDQSSSGTLLRRFVFERSPTPLD